AMLRTLAWSFGNFLAFCLLAVIWPGLYGQAVMGKGDLRMISLYTEAGALPAGFSLPQLPEVANAVESIRLQMVSADALRSMLFIGIAMITLLAFIKNKISAAVTVAIVGIAAMTDLYGADKRYINSESFSEPRQAGTFTPSAADRAILADTDPHYRVLDVAQFSAAAPSFFHKSIGGYHAAKLTRYQDLIERQIIPGLQSGNLNAINMLNAKYIITDPNAAPVLNDSALGNAWFVGNVSYVDSADDEMAALDVIDPATEAVAAREFADVLGAATPADSTDVITLTDYAPDRLTYRSRSASGGVAVFSEVYFPWGWKATVDGEETPVARVNYVLRAMRLPAGEHEVVMTFDPRSIHVTDTVATASAGLIYLIMISGIAGAMICYRRRGCKLTEEEKC
ncbi:MAG: YfhO family protein, partial [Muribaculaceae bacterium]|nr:YfhO family protein [Muribaculaceae bacterium]